jgi:hypothetical protein
MPTEREHYTSTDIEKETVCKITINYEGPIRIRFQTGDIRVARTVGQASSLSFLTSNLADGGTVLLRSVDYFLENSFVSEPGRHAQRC